MKQPRWNDAVSLVGKNVEYQTAGEQSRKKQNKHQRRKPSVKYCSMINRKGSGTENTGKFSARETPQVKKCKPAKEKFLKK